MTTVLWSVILLTKGVLVGIRLEYLCLSCVIVDDNMIGKIISGSPCLESLELNDCHGFKRIDVTSKCVKKLVFSEYCYDVASEEDYIDCTNHCSSTFSSLTNKLLSRLKAGSDTSNDDRAENGDRGEQIASIALQKFQLQVISAQDKRMKFTSEILNNMKIIKVSDGIFPGTRGTTTLNRKHRWLVEQKLCEGMATAGSFGEVIEVHEAYLLSILQCFLVQDKLVSKFSFLTGFVSLQWEG
ncbi:hypothetical protein Tco_0339495 [Tanacetum coccineum]